MNNRVHIIDDDAAMRDSLTFLLEVKGFDVSAYALALDFLDLVEPEPGCILTDIRMPHMTGLELVRQIRAKGWNLPVIAMTGHGDVPLAVEAMKAGVVDFIEKPFAEDRLVQAVRAALSAQADPAPTNDARQAAQGRLASLSPREREVLVGVVAGKLNKMIAHDLDISPRTVEIYRANLMTKTGAKNLSELMRIALAAGL